MNIFKTFTAVLCAAAMSSAVFAEEAKAPAQPLSEYLEQLQAKLDHAARRANQPTSEGSAVVGLRGSKKESASKQLYWKGKKGDAAVAPEEIKAYRSAVEQARAGKNTEAVASLKAFEEKYPKSALLSDVQETLTHLSAVPQP